MTFRNAAMLMAAFCLVPPAASAQSARPAPNANPPLTVVTTPPPAAAAATHVTLGERPAILYDGLSTKSNKLFILARYQPLEVLVRLDKWTKVRDAEGAIGWVENSFLGERKFVQIAAASAEIRAAALPTSPLVFEAQRGVLLEVTGPITEGWLPVRHRDGQSGFVRAAQVWGS